MKRIQILGPGCPKCEKLAELTRDVATAAGIEFEMEKVADIQEIMKFGVMITPALVVDGQVKFSGKIPDRETIEKMLTS